MSESFGGVNQKTRTQSHFKIAKSYNCAYSASQRLKCFTSFVFYVCQLKTIVDCLELCFLDLRMRFFFFCPDQCLLTHLIV